MPSIPLSMRKAVCPLAVGDTVRVTSGRSIADIGMIGVIDAIDENRGDRRFYFVVAREHGASGVSGWYGAAHLAKLGGGR